MHKYEATIAWQRGTQVFVDNRYRRAHEWRFDGGACVAASSSPVVVPLPMSDATAVDPEEALVAAVSSCHMLFFLSLAAKRKFIIDAYTDAAYGVMEKNDEGKLAMTRITLCPKIVFSGEHIPVADDIAALHHAAHEQCFIANSIKSDVVIEAI